MHDLRHPFDLAVVNNGLSIDDVKDLLGHVSIATIRREAHVSQDRLVKGAENVVGHYRGWRSKAEVILFLTILESALTVCRPLQKGMINYAPQRRFFPL